MSVGRKVPPVHLRGTQRGLSFAGEYWALYYSFRPAKRRVGCSESHGTVVVTAAVFNH